MEAKIRHIFTTVFYFAVSDRLSHPLSRPLHHLCSPKLGLPIHIYQACVPFPVLEISTFKVFHFLSRPENEKRRLIFVIFFVQNIFCDLCLIQLPYCRSVTTNT